MNFRIAEFPNKNWIIKDYLPIPIDRGATTAQNYLNDLGVEFIRGFNQKADLHLLPQTGRSPILKNYLKYFATRSLNFGKNPLHLIIEPREIAPIAYRFAPPQRTLASAPGKDFQRMVFPGYWQDPQLENWHKRMDRIVWFARPYPDRVQYAKHLIELGVPLDIYNFQNWNLPNWKGPAENSDTVAKNYKYQMIIEPSLQDGFHSEKLFKSIGSGCVTFFRGAVTPDISHVPKVSLMLETENLLNRNDLSGPVLENMGKFMFSDQWKIYSSKQFFDRILDFTPRKLNHVF